MPYCKKCGKELDPLNKFCIACGTPVESNQTQSNIPNGGIPDSSDNLETARLDNHKCKTCGANIDPAFKFCKVCGTPVKADNSQNNFANNNTNAMNSQNVCRNCGNQNAPNRTVCAFCGAPLTQGNQQQFYNNSQQPNNQYYSNYPDNQNKKSNKTLIIVLTCVIAVVLVVAAVIFSVLILPNILNGSSPNSNGQNNFSSNTYEQATNAITEPITEIPTIPATEAQTNPPTEAPTVAKNDKPYDQYIEVVSNGTSATLTLYEWSNGSWHNLMSTYATVGQNGVGSNYGEGNKVTPRGTFDLGFCYGLNKPVTNLRFKQVSNGSIFVSDSSSPYYNCLVTLGEYNGTHAENTYRQFAQDGTYSCNIFIEHNGDGETPNSATPGLGSVITICGYNGTLKPTWGCIDITSSDMTKLLSYLDSSKNPKIIIS